MRHDPPTFLGFPRRFAHFLPLFALAGLVASAVPALAERVPPGGWELVKESDGVTIERRSVEGSGIKAFRGRGQVRASVATILAVFNDVPAATQWMDRCSASQLVADLGDLEKVIYNRTRATWPVSDRDTVVRARISIEPNLRRVFVDVRSEKNAKKPPVDGVVRMPFLHGHWSFEPSADGATTKVEYEVHADPGGSLPEWIVNYGTRDLPLKTINGLRAQVKRRNYPEFQRQLRERYAQYSFLWPNAGGERPAQAAAAPASSQR